MGKETASWVFILAGADVFGWVCLIGLTNFEWLYANNVLWTIRATLFQTRMKPGGVPAMLGAITGLIGKFASKFTAELEAFFSHAEPLQQAAQTFCTPTFQAVLSSWCHQWHFAWVAGMIMATCIGFASLFLVVGSVILHFYNRQPTRRGWTAMVWCFTAAPAMLFGGFVTYAIMTSSFGDDEFAKMTGVEALGAPGPKCTWGVGFIFGQCLTALSACPAAVVLCGMERHGDDTDVEEFIGKEIVSRAERRKSSQYGAHASSARAVGSALTGLAGHGMSQPAPGMYTMEVVQGQFVDTHLVPAGYSEAQVQMQPMPLIQPPPQPPPQVQPQPAF